MNLIDLIIIIPIAWFAYRGFKKGLILEVFSLLSFFAGIYSAIHFSDFASNLLSENFKIKSEYLPLISFALTFLAVVILINLLGRLITKLVNAVALSSVNKIVGAAFSVLKIALVLGVVLGFINTANEKFQFMSEETKESSLLYHPLIKTTETVLPAIKESKYYEQFEKWREERKKDKEISFLAE